MWAVLTRLEEPKKHNLSVMQKLKLYNGKSLPGYTERQRQGASQGGRPRGHGRHLAPLRPGQDLERLGRRARSALRQPVHGAERAGGRAARGHSLDHQRGAAPALPRASGRRAARVRGHRQERGAARHRRRRGRDLAPVRELRRQHQGVHAEGEGPEPVHRPGRGARRAADALDRGEDRHPRQPQGRLPPGDHELHRRACRSTGGSSTTGRTSGCTRRSS